MDTRLLTFTVLCVYLTFVSGQYDFEDMNQEETQVYELNAQEAKNIKPRAFQTQHLSQNRVVDGPEDGIRFVDPPALQHFRNNYPNEVEQYQKPQLQQRPQQQQVRRPSPLQHEKKLALALQEEEDELEKEEPDRLSQLLPNSKFGCSGRTTGYYADEELQCEVFHYCQDNTKHSWICPDGFTFHQVHLICMPPSNDNICQKSSQYHFVNDYLYKALNAEEAQTKPNVTLRYSERFYPSEVYHDARYDEEEDYDREQVQSHAPRRQPARPQSQAQNFPTRRPQVFRSPEEVDIPLVQRRPTHIPQPFHPSNSHDFDYEKK